MFPFDDVIVGCWESTTIDRQWILESKLMLKNNKTWRQHNTLSLLFFRPGWLIWLVFNWLGGYMSFRVLREHRFKRLSSIPLFKTLFLMTDPPILDTTLSNSIMEQWNIEMIQLSGTWFNKKMSSYQYRKSHCGDKTVVRSSYLHNGISYTGKTTSLYWIRALVSWDGYFYL